MKRLRLLVAGAIVVGSLAVAPAASADENCVGAEGIAVVCAEPLGHDIYVTCVYTGGDTCQPVVVPGPDVTRCDIGPNNPPLVLIVVIEAVCEGV